MVSEANVSIDRIEMRLKGSEEESDFIVLTDVDTVLNLVDLQNGVVATLAEIEVPAGDYDEVRVITGDAEIILTDGRSFDLKIPSGSQSGIKIKVTPGIVVEGGLTTELLLDFDLSKSFVVKGDPSRVDGINGFNFKPVIRAINSSTAGRVSGTIIRATDDAPLENVYLVLTPDESTETTYEAYTAADGTYTFLGVPAGDYSLTASIEGYEDGEYVGIEVIAGNRTTADLLMTVK